MKKKKDTKQVVIFQAKSGAIELRGDISRETIWATRAQIAEVFQAERSVITKHIRNILKDKEIGEKSNVQKMHIPNSDKPVAFYSLDIILAVGYRTNSKRAIEFRKWATKTLREHVLKGYTINRKLIAKNYEAFMKSVSDIQALLPEHIMLDPKAILELVKEFSSTWMSLEAYDKDALTTVGTTKKSIMLSGRELTDAVASFRLELMKGGSATEIFAQERATRSIEGIVGNVMQSFGGKPVYESVEERAAHLLYFYGKKSSIHGRQQAKRSVCVYLVFAEGESEKIPQHQSSNSDGFDASYRRKRTKEKGANDRIGNTITEITYQQT